MLKKLQVILCTAVAIGSGVAASVAVNKQMAMPIVDESLNQLPAELVSWTGRRDSNPAVIGTWPPHVGERYPDLLLEDHQGNPGKLSDLEGKVILMELAAIPCKGCQAFAGGKKHGGYGGFSVQRDLDSIHDYAKRFAGVGLGRGDGDVVLVQVLLYGAGMSAPTREEVSGWAKHFQLDQAPNTLVLRGDASMLGKHTYDMIPGFHLIDRDFVLRYDSSGHRPKHDLYRDLLPALGEMVR